MDLRNRLYDAGWLRSYDLGAPTISIGNLTAGGTGKTPLAAMTADILSEGGERVCILTRGYGRKNAGSRVLVSDGEHVLADAAAGGDEPVELGYRLLGKAIVVADADRVAAANWVREKFGITVFLLDDGFQHRRARRDLDIVCIDATNPCGNGRLLPAGRLRESFRELRRADAIVLTRANLVASTDDIAGRLRKRNPSAPIFRASTRIIGTADLAEFPNGQRLDATASGIPCFMFCGLGAPENFRRQLELQGFSISGHRFFPDHHRYTQADASTIVGEAKQTGASVIVTTAKDAVKLDGIGFDLPVLVAIADVRIENEAEFRSLILDAANLNAANH